MKIGLQRLKLRKELQREKKKKIKFAVIATLCVTLAIILVTFVSSLSEGKTVQITIEAGTPTTQIAAMLKDEGLINSKTLFLVRLQFSKYRNRLQYGTFEFNTNDSTGDIIKTLGTQGAKKTTITFTVPEGYSAERIASRAQELGICTKEEFKAALSENYDYEFLKAIPHSSDIKYHLQGFLYPQTYEFYSNAEPEYIINTMLAEFEKRVLPLGIPQDKLYDVITKASMIEREAKIKSEQPIIAGVIENRLKQNMPLQLDATVVYAISDGMYDVERVFYKDLEIDSKYNTYKYARLPAGPICSPGLSAIKAALNPQQHNYLFYHTDTEKNDGSHIFTENFEQHTSTMAN